jgi:ribA/ribD-fused uncharacterized protein
MFGNNTVAHRIMAIQTDENHPLYNNGIIQDFFTIEPAPNDRMPFKLVPKDKNLSNDELNDFTSAFEEIKQFDRELYEDLLTVSLFQTGVVQSPSSFYDVVPYYDIIPKVSEAIIQQSSTTLDPTQIAERILSNIGTRLSNLKRVTFDVGFYNGGTLNLTEENAGRTQKMQFINATIMGRNEFNEPQRITSGIFRRVDDLTYVKIDPRNDGYMFQNLADSNTRQMFPPDDFFNDDYTDVEITPEKEEEEEIIPKEIVTQTGQLDLFNQPQVSANLPGPETKINIYAGKGENAELSNFANRPFIYDDFKFNTVEGAFQAHKFSAAMPIQDNYKEIIEKLQTATGAEAKGIGQKIQNLNKEIWDNNNSTIMKNVIKASFEQNPKALQTLLATGNATLTHTQESPKSKWREKFPELLMEVRKELRGTQSQAPVAEVKPGVKELFDSNPELSTIGTQEQYSQYLDSIFPDSQVKDIVYRGIDEKYTKNIEKEDKNEGIYFTTNFSFAKNYGDKVFSSLLNILSPKITEYDSKLIYDNSDIKTIKSEMANFKQNIGFQTKSNNINFDGVIGLDKNKTHTEIAVFDKTQIHILGNKQDIEGFKKFTAQPQAPVSNVEITKTTQETKEEAPWFTWNDLSLAQRKKLSSKTNQEEFDSWSKDKQDKFVACNG